MATELDGGGGLRGQATKKDFFAASLRTNIEHYSKLLKTNKWYFSPLKVHVSINKFIKSQHSVDDNWKDNNIAITTK